MSFFVVVVVVLVCVYVCVCVCVCVCVFGLFVWLVGWFFFLKN